MSQRKDCLLVELRHTDEGASRGSWRLPYSTSAETCCSHLLRKRQLGCAECLICLHGFLPPQYPETASVNVHHATPVRIPNCCQKKTPPSRWHPHRTPPGRMQSAPTSTPYVQYSEVKLTEALRDPQQTTKRCPHGWKPGPRSASAPWLGPRLQFQHYADVSPFPGLGWQELPKSLLHTTTQRLPGEFKLAMIREYLTPSAAHQQLQETVAGSCPDFRVLRAAR